MKKAPLIEPLQLKKQQGCTFFAKVNFHTWKYFPTFATLPTYY